MDKKLAVIDGNSLINRAFYALPPLNTVDGVPSQAVYGFATMLIKLITDYKPDYLAVAFDMAAPTFRHKKYAEYKATRKGMPDELAVQMPLLKEMLSLMGITILEKEGFEADDIIGTLAKHSGIKTMIVTGDRDSLQLVDNRVSVMLTKRGITDVVILTGKNMKEETGLEAEQVVDYKALSGDSSDNIPGIAGIGDKTAKQLLERFGTLDALYESIEEVTGAVKQKLIAGKETAYLSKELAGIDIDMPLEYDIEKMVYEFPFSGKTKEYFNHMNFRSLIKRADLFATAECRQSNKCKTDIINVITYEQLEEILSADVTSAAIVFDKHLHIAFDEEREYSIDLSADLISTGLNYDECISRMKDLFESKLIRKIVLDAKAAKKELQKYGVSLFNYWDLGLAQYLVDMSADYSSPAALISFYGLEENESATGFFYICKSLDAELKSLSMDNLFYEIELPLVDILFGMETAGFRLDINRLDELEREMSGKISVLEQKIYELSGETFNINSPKQLAEVLFEKMKIPYPRKSKTYSTGAEILEDISDRHEIINYVLQYRLYAKLKGTYLVGLKKLADKNDYVHTDFRQTLTTTGRLSSVEPNLQNIPIRDDEGRILREIFIAGENSTLVCADYSQIELRLLAHYSGDEIMQRAYRTGEDIHTQTASEVFSVPKEAVTSNMRRDAKAVNFGIIYGISDYGLSRNLKIPPSVARDYIDKYFHKFPSVKKYQADAVDRAKKTGYAETLFGRKRKIPELSSPNYNVRQFGERAAMNMPLQGTAADIIKIAMIRVAGALSGMKSKLILQVHDELIIDADDGEIDAVKKILSENMSESVKLNIPLEVDIKSGKRWSDC